jgi:2-polyprenyl-3-methyl-5-hydroxy-6-metoxy-1,4-benzoquinol methylase
MSKVISEDVGQESWSVVAAHAEIRGTRIGESRWRITTRSTGGKDVPRASCDTSFPRALIEQLLRTTDPEWICDAIARFEDPAYVRKVLQDQIFSYFAPSSLDGKRVLDFGCGNGASTSILARLLPNTEVIGVELDPARIAEGTAILSHLRLPNVQLLQSPAADALPPGIGQFDFVMLSAVFEHLLPHEREVLMPLLWSHVRVGGAVFINQTPHRWHPYEHHSSELWGINYLPNRVAWWVAHHLGRRTRANSWEEMLRGGIRGGTERSIRVALTAGCLAEAEVLTPSQHGLRDRADYWLHCTSARGRAVKRVVAHAFRLSDALFGTVPAVNIDVVLRKRADRSVR